MIPRVRPEVTLGDVARIALSGVGDEPLNTLARALPRAAALPEPVLLTPSGRAALYLLFRASSQPVVYMPAYNCWAVLEAARLAGKPVRYLDIDHPGVHVPLERYDEVCREPGIVVTTHQFGYPEDVVAVRETLEGRGHLLVEDCAGALLSRMRGAPVGHAGDAAIFSFEAGKLLTTGGGALTVRDTGLRDDIVRIMQREQHAAGGLTELGLLAWRRFSTIGPVYSMLLRAWLAVAPPTQGQHDGADVPTALYRRGMSPRQAELGLKLLAGIDALAARRRALWRLYHDAVSEMPGVTAVTLLEGGEPCPIRFPFLVPRDRKAALYDAMRRRGVDLGFTFSYALDPACSGAAEFAAGVLNLPVHAGVDEARGRRILDALRDCLHELEAGG